MKDETKVSLVLWIIAGILLLNFFIICPIIPDAQDCRVYPQTPYKQLPLYKQIIETIYIGIIELIFIPCLLVIMGFLVLLIGFMFVHPLKSFFLFCRKKTNKNPYYIIQYLGFGLASIIMIIITVTCLMYTTNNKKEILSSSLFNLGDKVVCASDPKQTPGIVIKCSTTSNSKNNSTSYLYDVKFISYDTTNNLPNFKVLTFKEFELQKADFIDYRN